MPTSQKNRQKTHAINGIIDKTDIVILTESGIKQEEKMWTCHDNMVIAKENKVR